MSGRADQHRGAEVLHCGFETAVFVDAARESRPVGPGELRLVGVGERPVVHQQAPAVQHAQALIQILLRDPVQAQGRLDLPRDPEPGGARAVNHDPLIGELLALDPERGEDAGQGNGTGTLNVVVERQHPVAVALQDGEGVVLAQVLPLDQRSREQAGERLDELGDQLVVGLARHPLAAPAEIQVVLQQLPVVGADVQADGQGCGGIDACTGRVQRKLAHRDRHTAGALIADAENGLVVGNHRQAHVAALGRGLQHLADAAAIGGRDPQAPPTLKHLTELLGRQAHRGRIDDGHELRQVVLQQPVVEMLVAVLQGRQLPVAIQRVVHHGEPVVYPFCLLVLGIAGRRQQTGEAEQTALLRGERAAFVQQRVAHHRVAAKLGMLNLRRHQPSPTTPAANRRSISSQPNPTSASTGECAHLFRAPGPGV